MLYYGNHKYVIQNKKIDLLFFLNDEFNQPKILSSIQYLDPS